MSMSQTSAAALVATALAEPGAAQEGVPKVHHFWPPGATGPSTLLAPWCDKCARDLSARHETK